MTFHAINPRRDIQIFRAMKLWHSPGTTSTWCLMRRLTKAADNADIDFSILGVSTWYQESTREEDDTHFPSSSRASDALTGADTTSYQVREPIENDEERLAMKRGDMPPPVPQRVVNPRIREDQALHEFYSNSDKMHCATPMTSSHKHDLIMTDLPSHSLWEKQVQTLNFSTCLRTSVAPSSTTWSRFDRKVNSGDQRTCYQKWKVQCRICVTSQGILMKQLRACDSDSRSWQLIDRRKEVAWGQWLGGIVLKQNQWSVSPRKNWFCRVCSSPACGIKWRRRQKNACSDLWSKFGKKAEGAMTDSRERTADTL